MSETLFLGHVTQPERVLFEGVKIPHEYVPIEMNLKYEDSVLVHDRSMVDKICAMTIGLAHNPHGYMLPAVETKHAGEKVRFQIVQKPDEFLYHMTFIFPLGTFLSQSRVNEIMGLFPNRFIARDCGPYMGTNEFRWVVTMFNKSCYSESIVYIYNKPTVIIVDTPALGPNDEGVPSKRGHDEPVNKKRKYGGD